MKPFLVLSSYLLLASSALADSYPSPDSKWSVSTGNAVTLNDASGSPVLTIIKNTGGATLIQPLWSPDSKRVVVIEDYPRGSAVCAAWFDGKTWDKALQSDEDEAAAIKQAQGSNGRLQAEARLAKSWIDEKSVLIQGELQFSSGNSRGYHYILEFTDQPGKRDKGGYLEGVIKGTHYELL
jgi:hypothetical protein